MTAADLLLAYLIVCIGWIMVDLYRNPPTPNTEEHDEDTTGRDPE